MLKAGTSEMGVRIAAVLGLVFCVGGQTACSGIFGLPEDFWVEEVSSPPHGSGGSGGVSSTGAQGGTDPSSSNGGMGGKNDVGGAGGGSSSSGSTGGAGGAGGTEGTLCEPFAQIPCYSGSLGTMAVGKCQAGTQTCNAFGTALGPCEGEVLPDLAELCGTPEDDDCDGQVVDIEDGCICSPGESHVCYSGPNMTMGIGTCAGGQAVCSPDGKSFGPCLGEVVPTANDCPGAVDSNCDGVITSCPGVLPWAQGFGTASFELATGIALDQSGASYIIGDFYGPLDFGNGTGLLAHGGLSDVFLVKLDFEGKPLWSHHFGDGGTQHGNAVTVDKNGAGIVTGMFAGSMDFGDQVLVSNGDADIFLAKFDTSGVPVWSKKIGGIDSQIAQAVATDKSAQIYLTGGIIEAVDFGCGMTSGIGSDDVFVAKFSQDGTCLFSKRYGNPAHQFGTGIAVDDQGDIFVGGYFYGSLNFGCGNMLSGNGAGGTDIFLAKLSPSGSCIWSKRFGDASDQRLTGLSLDSTGNVFLVGHSSGAVDFGGGTLTSAGGNDIVIAAFDGMGGLLWNHIYGGVGEDIARAMAVNNMNISVTGDFGGAIDFGGGVYNSVGGADIFLLRMTTGGAYLSSMRFGDGTDQWAYSVAMDINNNNILAGSFSGFLDMGMSTLNSSGAEDIFVVKLVP